MMKEQAMSYTFDEQILSDLHKDARGFRPRDGFWRHWNESTMDEKQAMWDGLLRELDLEMERERQQQEAAVAHFEANIQRNMELGAPDRETAIRWVLQSLDPDSNDLAYGGSWATWSLGLPYSMSTLFDPIMKEMR